MTAARMIINVAKTLLSNVNLSPLKKRESLSNLYFFSWNNLRKNQLYMNKTEVADKTALLFGKKMR